MSLFGGISRHAFQDDSVVNVETHGTATSQLNNANGVLLNDHSPYSELGPLSVYEDGRSFAEYNGHVDDRDLSITARTTFGETLHNKLSADDGYLIQPLFYQGLTRDWVMPRATVKYKSNLTEDETEEALTQLQPYYSIPNERQPSLDQLFVSNDSTIYYPFNLTVEQILAATDIHVTGQPFSPASFARWAMDTGTDWPMPELGIVPVRPLLSTVSRPYEMDIVEASYPISIQRGILKALAVANQKLGLIDQFGLRYQDTDAGISNNGQKALRSFRALRGAKRLRRIGSNVRLVKHPKYRSSSRLGLRPEFRGTQLPPGFDDGVIERGDHTLVNGTAKMRHAFSNQFYQANSIVPTRRRLVGSHRLLRGLRLESCLEYFKPSLPLRPGPLKIREVPLPQIKPASFPSVAIHMWEQAKTDALPLARRRSVVYLEGTKPPSDAESPPPLWTTGVITESRIAPLRATRLLRRRPETGLTPKYILQVAPRIRRTVVVLPPTAANPEEYTSRFGPALLSSDQLLAVVKKLGIEEALVHPPEVPSVQIEVLSS